MHLGWQVQAPATEGGQMITARGTTGAGRGPAAARVRELLQERQRITTAHVRTVVEGRDRLGGLREEASRLTGDIEGALHELVNMGYSRQEIAALCDIAEEDIPRRRRASNDANGRRSRGAGTGQDATRPHVQGHRQHLEGPSPLPEIDGGT